MGRDHILAIDQGTTSTRVVVYDARLQVRGQAQREVPPSYPASGWVEHDVAGLVGSIGPMVTLALADAKITSDRLLALGLTNQRETAVIWDRTTGEAIHPALVWQDRRTAPICEQLAHARDWVTERTGLVLDPYFSATKWRWILDHVPSARARAEAGKLAAGTVDSLILWHLTGGRRHVTDVTNASRTLLMDIERLAWNDELCELFAVPRGILPEILPSAGNFGVTHGLDYLPDGLPVTGVAGDQQASLIGQGCVFPGQAKCTYGTGAFLLVHAGCVRPRSEQGLIATLAATLEISAPQYALEGSVFIAGAAVQWFRDGLKAIGASEEINPLSLGSHPDSDVLFVPALTGLGAPHWCPEARGTLFGLTRATGIADLARATLEGVGHQVADLVEAMHADNPENVSDLRVDGGMARSDVFLQFQADLLGITLQRSPNTESTAQGAALLAGLGQGLWTPADIPALIAGGLTAFTPGRDHSWRRSARKHWRHAVESVRRHYLSQP